MESNKVSTIDAYIEMYSPELQQILQTIRRAIQEAAPDATEKISYAMPTFFLHKNLVHFAVCKNHIGFYPTPSGVEAFAEEISQYGKSKGSIHFPLDEPMPIDLIKKIVQFRVQENMVFAPVKGKKK